MSDLPPIDGEFLKNMRKKRGWSQTTLADYLGVSQARISKFEQGAKIKTPYQKLLMQLILAPPEGKKVTS
ncbi:helix-turn-helix domain-containing protein [Agrobacterium rubi]|uniref:Helix-turn-helix domain-containing protein n=1 Tax=Agrobacterium rubi TaxID=28099 RepID=A0ABX2IXR2_9HYPH|nr:helix-turn-helix domain-containing protein [Agrobacterium rubi]